MSVNGMPESSLRAERRETSRVAWAFLISVALHLGIFGLWHTGNRFGWWHDLSLPAWLQTPKLLTEILKKEQPKPPPQREMPLIFVDVSPEQAAPEPPKDAPYYSDKNSIAANASVTVESTVPNIDGRQLHVPKTENIPREKFTPLQPALPVQEPKPAQEEMKAKPTQEPGDLTLAKPDPNPNKEEGQQKHTRPQTVEEAKMLPENRNRTAGQKMKQEGGVRRHLEIDSLDAKGTEFGFYDAYLVRVIANCWYGLLDEQRYASDYQGKVVVQFHLHYDGTISDLSVADNTAGTLPGLICETAVDKPRPFQKFPSDMRRVVGDVRYIQFTFYYN